MAFRGATRLYYGTFVHALKPGDVTFLPSTVVAVGSDGIIQHVQSVPDGVAAVRSQADHGAEVVDLTAYPFVIPGFIDTHQHAPQYRNAGNGTDLPLLDWLNTYTFPTETRMKDADFASDVYTRAVTRSLRLGTTTALWFGTIHLEASKRLADVCVSLGQRAFIGKVNMDRNAPEHYVESTAASLADTRAFVQYTLGLGNPLVQPIITPRFVPTCSAELMSGLGAIAKEYDLHIQSHVSENVNEIAWVKELHPDIDTYTGVYDAMGLLTDKCILAHGVHLTDNEIALLRQRGAAISHCANSNFTLTSGVLDIRRLTDAGVKVGLGTDVSGGYSSSMLNAMQQAVIASNVTRVSHPERQALEYKEAFYLATQGGAASLGLGDVVGTFEVGKAFDAVVAQFPEGGPIDIFDTNLEEQFQKFIFLADDRNIQAVYVNGALASPFTAVSS